MIFCLLLASCSPLQAVQSQTLESPTASMVATQPSAPSNVPTVKVEPTYTPAPKSTPASPTKRPETAVPKPQSDGQGKVPNFDHIVMIVLENRDYEEVVGNSHMPFLNALVKQNVLLTNDYAVRHPSLPNYIALVSGDTQNITKDCIDCFVNAKNLADLIEASGRTWKTYQESMPSACFVGDANPYAQKHNPFIYFDSIRLNEARCKKSIVPLTTLDGDLAANQLPNFAFIMPNLCNSGHDCPLDIADKWVNQMVTKLQASTAFGKNSLIMITYDEGNDKNTASCCGMGSKAGGRIAALLISPLVKPGFTDGTPLSHYSLLKTILQAWNLPDLGHTAQAETQAIVEAWQ
jgi:phospholipase C